VVQTVILVVVGLIVLAIVVVLVAAAMKSDAFRIQRSTTIQAPPEKVFAHINDFRRWIAWSPWEKLDPELKRTFSGKPTGKGSVYEWEGNKKVGQGRMEITEASPPNRINIQLDFLKPFVSHNTTEFALQPQGHATNVTWVMNGRQPYMFKVMTLFLSIDKMIGKDFEAGLADLKAVSEQ
jgi:uncharacterized protein YndB with AHSA1/START domain